MTGPQWPEGTKPVRARSRQPSARENKEAGVQEESGVEGESISGTLIGAIGVCNEGMVPSGMRALAGRGDLSQTQHNSVNNPFFSKPMNKFLNGLDGAFRGKMQTTSSLKHEKDTSR